MPRRLCHFALVLLAVFYTGGAARWLHEAVVHDHAAGHVAVAHHDHDHDHDHDHTPSPADPSSSEGCLDCQLLTRLAATLAAPSAVALAPSPAGYQAVNPATVVPGFNSPATAPRAPPLS